MCADPETIKIFACNTTASCPAVAGIGAIGRAMKEYNDSVHVGQILSMVMV